MLVFDELKKNEPQLRFVAVMLTAGLCILLAGLWWVQVVSAREYQEHLTTQSSRTIRLPAVRGKILDRAGRVLAENQPCYNLSLYLDDLSGQFKSEYNRLRPVKITTNVAPFWKFWSSAKSVETNRARLKSSQISALTWQARCNVANRIVVRAGEKLGQPLTLNVKNFQRAFETRLALPYPFLENLTSAQIARFEENYSGDLGANLELESVRHYPNGTLAGHLLGYLLEDNRSMEGEESSFNYRLPDYHGVVGVEYGYDGILRGRAGSESVLVNSVGYRESENIGNQPEPGNNVVLTLDLDLQRAAEKSLAAHQGTNACGAIVVMDVRNGDVLAMVSSPAINPDYSENSPARINDAALRPSINRATQQNYAPGSIFKPIVALACLENGLNPNALVDNPGYVMVGRRKVHDLAAPGEYNLKLAIMHSSNTYFITVGLQAGIEHIIRMAEKFHFGERTGLRTRQETSGILPTLERVSHGWTDGDTANLSIGQGDLSVTPLQMAVAYAAIANGGKIFWPRLVSRIEPQDPTTHGTATNLPSALLRDQIGVSPKNLQILHSAMLAETQEGTGQAAQVAGLQICGKTGTAQIMDERNRETGVTTWFASFAPYENPRYSVIVMVEGVDTYGGPICAPIAHDIYEAILKEETSGTAKTLAAR